MKIWWHLMYEGYLSVISLWKSHYEIMGCCRSSCLLNLCISSAILHTEIKEIKQESGRRKNMWLRIHTYGLFIEINLKGKHSGNTLRLRLENIWCTTFPYAMFSRIVPERRPADCSTTPTYNNIWIQSYLIS